MDILKMIENLAVQARKEKTPITTTKTHISNQVLARIIEIQSNSRILPLSIFAVGSAIAACIILFLGFTKFTSTGDPIMEFFKPLELLQLTLLW